MCCFKKQFILIHDASWLYQDVPPLVTVNPRGLPLPLPVTAHISEDSQEKSHEKGVVNIALPVELRLPGYKDITMESKQRGLQ